MSIVSEDNEDRRKVVIKSPMPAVWGLVVGGEFWWDVQHDRWIMRSEAGVGSTVDLYVGGYCDTHAKMEGQLLGSTTNLREALAWIAGGVRPRGASVH